MVTSMPNHSHPIEYNSNGYAINVMQWHKIRCVFVCV